MLRPHSNTSDSRKTDLTSLLQATMTRKQSLLRATWKIIVSILVQSEGREISFLGISSTIARGLSNFQGLKMSFSETFKYLAKGKHAEVHTIAKDTRGQGQARGTTQHSITKDTCGQGQARGTTHHHKRNGWPGGSMRATFISSCLNFISFDFT